MAEGERPEDADATVGRRRVDGDLGGRARLGGLTAEAVGSPERLVVDDERLGLRSGHRAAVEGLAIVGQRRIEVDVERQRRAAPSPRRGARARSRLLWTPGHRW